MKLIKRTIAAILVCAMALSVSACSGDTSWAYKYNDDTVAAGVYIMYLYDGYNSARSTYQTENPDGDASNFLNEKVEDKDAKQWIKDYAARLSKARLATQAWLKELNVTVNESDLSYYDQMSDYYWSSMQSMYESVGVSEESFKEYFRTTPNETSLFQAIYGEGGTEEVSDDELRPYFNENFYQFKYVSGSYYKSGTALSDAEKTLVRQRFEGYLAQMQEEGLSIDDISVLEAEYQQSVSTSSSSASSETEITTETNPASAMTLEKDNIQYFSESVMTQIGETENDAVTLAEDDYGVYLIYKQDITADDDNYSQYRNSALYSMKEDEFYDELDSKAESMGIETNQSAINHYDPKMFIEMENNASAAS